MRHLILTSRARLRVAAVLLVSTALLVACGQSEKFNRAAYDVCLVAAKADAKVGKASFSTFEQSKVASSTGDDQFRVNIPYELGGQKGLYQCIAEKRQDGSFAAVF